MMISEILDGSESTLIGCIIGNSTHGDTTFTAEMSGKPWNGDFDCSHNNLASLDGAPSSTTGFFRCSYNYLTSLKGAPSSIGSYFDCSSNELASLHDIHKIIKKMNGEFWANHNPIKSCILGVLLIEGCNEIIIDDAIKVSKIINKYLPNTRGFSAVINCQSELLDAGFDEFAKL